MDTEGKWLLSRPCQQVPHQKRVSISELLSNLCTQEKQSYSPDAMTSTGAHMDTGLLQQKTFTGNFCERSLWLQLIKCHLGACNFCRITSSKRDFFVENISIPWNYLISMRTNNRFCKDTFSWNISWWSSLSTSIPLLFHLPRITGLQNILSWKEHARIKSQLLSELGHLKSDLSETHNLLPRSVLLMLSSWMM